MTGDKETQIEKLKQAARDLETDDSEESFDRALRKVAQTGRKEKRSDDDDKRKPR